MGMQNKIKPSAAPIGVFDSGVGGLTVLHWLLKQASRPRRVQQSDMAIYGMPANDADKSDVAAIRSLDEA